MIEGDSGKKRKTREGESCKFYLLLSLSTIKPSNNYFLSNSASDSCPYHIPPQGMRKIREEARGTRRLLYFVQQERVTVCNNKRLGNV